MISQPYHLCRAHDDTGIDFLSPFASTARRAATASWSVTEGKVKSANGLPRNSPKAYEDTGHFPAGHISLADDGSSDRRRR